MGVPADGSKFWPSTPSNSLPVAGLARRHCSNLFGAGAGTVESGDLEHGCRTFHSAAVRVGRTNNLGKPRLLAEHAVITMAEVLIGLALGAVLGFISAISLVAWPTARALVRPILVFSQAVPVFAFAPILILWLGFGPRS